jgi:hypothetical protein
MAPFVYLAMGLGSAMPAHAQQTASTVEPPRTVDRSYTPSIAEPAYAASQGPIVCVDEAHNNFHTAVSTYWPFARILRLDGYVVHRADKAISPSLLEGCAIYVIADAQPPERVGEPPTFSMQEIRVLHDWVRSGGSLFVITDHMPDPGAIADLAASFGIEVSNGYALVGSPRGPARPMVFSRSDGTLHESVITNGRGPHERVARVATFAGSAFRTGDTITPVLTFAPGTHSWMPREYWRFPRGTPNIDVTGWLQGGVSRIGEGRLAFFSEAAMFTAQVFDQGRVRAGMNAPEAKDNAQLLLNVMHWLSDIL